MFLSIFLRVTLPNCLIDASPPKKQLASNLETVKLAYMTIPLPIVGGAGHDHARTVALLMPSTGSSGCDGTCVRDEIQRSNAAFSSPSWRSTGLAAGFRSGASGGA